MGDYDTPNINIGSGLNVQYLVSEYATIGNKCALITPNENRTANNCFFGQNGIRDVAGKTLKFTCNVKATTNYTVAILEYNAGWKTVKYINCTSSTTSPELICTISEESIVIWPRLSFPRDTTEKLYTDNWILNIL